MEIRIDRDGCISCELCTEICPAVFRMADDGKAEVYGAPAAEDEAAVEEAAESCPVSVIHAAP